MGKKFIVVVSRQRVYHLYQADLSVLRCQWKLKRPPVPPFQRAATISVEQDLPSFKENEEESASTQLST
jgi:hypothetical protein